MKVVCASSALGFVLLLKVAYGNPVAHIKSSLGDFDIELFDDSAPLAVKSFISYSESGRYDGTLIHRSVPSFVVQGGWVTFQSQSNTFTSIEVDDAIPNEFGSSNIRGTVSLAKLGGDPNSATSQWFINLADNSKNLDNQNGGFTVFGRIIGDGMSVVDEIARLKTYNVGGIENFPLVNYKQGPISKQNLITISSVKIQAPEEGPNYFDLENSELRLALDAGGLGIATLALSIEIAQSPPIFTLLLNSIQWLDFPLENMAIFDMSDSSIFIPELFVDGKKAYKNLKLNLSDHHEFSFVLDSYEKI